MKLYNIEIHLNGHVQAMRLYQTTEIDMKKAAVFFASLHGVSIPEDEVRLPCDEECTVVTSLEGNEPLMTIIYFAS